MSRWSDQISKVMGSKVKVTQDLLLVILLRIFVSTISSDEGVGSLSNFAQWESRMSRWSDKIFKVMGSKVKVTHRIHCLTSVVSLPNFAYLHWGELMIDYIFKVGGSSVKVVWDLLHCYSKQSCRAGRGIPCDALRRLLCIEAWCPILRVSSTMSLAQHSWGCIGGI